MCRNFKFVDESSVKRGIPGGILTCLLKEYWPGLYKINPDSEEKKLATKWEDYEVVKSAGFMTDENGDSFVPSLAQVVHTKFWVRLSLSSSVHGSLPTMLTYDSHDKCFIHDCRNIIEWRRTLSRSQTRSLILWQRARYNK